MVVRGTILHTHCKIPSSLPPVFCTCNFARFVLLLCSVYSLAWERLHIFFLQTFITECLKSRHWGGLLFTRSILMGSIATRSTLTKSTCHKINSHKINSHVDQLPPDQLSQNQLATRSTLTRSTCHKINSIFFMLKRTCNEYYKGTCT